MSFDKDNQREIYTNTVKAGRRTYFFDVKTTLNNDYFITITESKKTTNNGKEEYHKHKIFLYKEDFDKVIEGLQDAVQFAKGKLGEENTSGFSNVEFEDL